MKKFFITAAALAALTVPSAAMADVTNNKSTKDAHGHATANAVVNIVKEGKMGVTFEQRGLGQFRSQEMPQVSAIGGIAARPSTRLGHRSGRLRPDQQQRQRPLLILPQRGWAGFGWPTPLTLPRASSPRRRLAGSRSLCRPKDPRSRVASSAEHLHVVQRVRSASSSEASEARKLRVQHPLRVVVQRRRHPEMMR